MHVFNLSSTDDIAVVAVRGARSVLAALPNTGREPVFSETAAAWAHAVQRANPM